MRAQGGGPERSAASYGCAAEHGRGAVRRAMETRRGADWRPPPVLPRWDFDRGPQAAMSGITATLRPVRWNPARRAVIANPRKIRSELATSRKSLRVLGLAAHPRAGGRLRGLQSAPAPCDLRGNSLEAPTRGERASAARPLRLAVDSPPLPFRVGSAGGIGASGGSLLHGAKKRAPRLVGRGARRVIGPARAQQYCSKAPARSRAMASAVRPSIWWRSIMYATSPSFSSAMEGEEGG